jgi:KAP family P-loop domain
LRFSPPEDDVTLYQTGFDDDLLGRAKVSKSLSEIVERIEDPLVIALDGRWGTGKSHFLKRWVGAHQLQNNGKALTIYFDAFAHDYLSDPLVALVGALSERVPKTDAAKRGRLQEAAFKFIKPVARIGLALATYGASEGLNALGDAAAEAIQTEAEKSLDTFWMREEGRQAAMDEFHAAIQALTTTDAQKDKTPLVIVIDELDRCRPDYALEILEIIKHFFAVDRVHFILGVNLEALENSVRARYGAAIDATAYLQKFLSLTLSLPDDIGDHNKTQSIVQYANHIGQKMQIPNEWLKEITIQIRVFAKCNQVAIRDVGKIMSYAALLPDEARNDRLHHGWRVVAVSMFVTKVIRPDMYKSLIDASFEKKKIRDYFGVSDQTISRLNKEGEINPDYSAPLLLLYAAWIYILWDGNVPDAEKTSEWPPIGNYFDNFGHTYDAKKIPQTIFNDWLNVFRLS